MERGFFQYKNSRISYCCFGSGPKTALCFHGFGEDAASFGFLEKQAGHLYRFISPDLPYHGMTEWNEGLNFSLNDLLQIMKGILQQNNIGQLSQNTASPDKKLSLLGFSLGGRIALSLYELIPGNVEKLVLMAPDGLKINIWYWFSTQTLIGNKIFAFTMRNPGWFFGLLKLMNKLGLVNASIFKFVNYYIGNAQIRRELYERWTCLRKLKPRRSRIKKFIRKLNTRLNLIYGRHDRIILPSQGEKFRKGIEDQCGIRIILSGHQVLQEKYAAEILPSLIQ